MKEILVTGSGGFIASHLVPQLLNQNYKIFGICKKKQNSSKNFVSLNMDITKTSNFRLRDNFSKIIHMAAFSDVSFCNQNPSKCYDLNVGGTQKMLEFARRRDSEFVFLSSSHVYGGSPDLPYSESDPCDPLSHYASSKRMSEILCEVYSKTYGLNIRVARIFSVYGPNSSKSNLVFSVIDQMLHHSKIILGNLIPKRDFIFIDDVISGLVSIINSRKKGYDAYNLGTGKSTSIRDLVNLLFNISNKKMRIISKSSKTRERDVLDIRADISKMKSHFNWKPQIPLNKGLKITYDYHSENGS